ncbi:MAG: T9SS type A sorting domain-containing protein [Bacteroidia bacterium]
MANATAVYDPVTMDSTPMIVPWATSIEKVLPKQIFALNNYPNPFNQTTTIQFGLLQHAKSVTLSVSNLFGQKVYEVTEDRVAAGTHEFTFDASNLSSGIYIYQINATGIDGQNFVASKRMILSK